MTLIIKELIIKGEVTDENPDFDKIEMTEEKLKVYLSQLKKEIEKDCYERIIEKIQNHSQR